MTLTIEEWKPEEELSPVEKETLVSYWDIKHHIFVHKVKINMDLLVGKKYNFTYEDYNDCDTYIYLILKKEDNNIYYIVEVSEDTKAYPTEKDRLYGNGWVKCNVKETLGIDLNDLV